jgi:hypothetical protein
MSIISDQRRDRKGESSFNIIEHQYGGSDPVLEKCDLTNNYKVLSKQIASAEASYLIRR